MLHGRVVRPPEMGATVAHVDEQSVRDVPGLTKVVVRKDFVGVVAQTQYQAVVAARQLVVRWNPGPSLPAQKTFFEHLQQQPSHDALSVDSRDVEAQLATRRQRGAGEIHLPLSNARIGRRILRGGRREDGRRDGVVCDPVGLSNAEYCGRAPGYAGR